VSAIVQGLGLICLVIAGWLWNTVVGIALLGGFLICGRLRTRWCAHSFG
jgi:hypothetical protein